MFSRILNHLRGFDTLKQRGDQFFLSGEFRRALAAYRRARSVLSESDIRAATVEALIRECQTRTVGDGAGIEELDAGDDEAEPPGEAAEPGEPSEFVPGLEDFFELAIADKPSERAAAYREHGQDFQAGYVALVQGDGEEAVRHLESATGSGFIVPLELGRALSLVGRMEEARAVLEAAWQSSRSDDEVGVLLSAVNIELGRFEEAKRILTPMARTTSGPEVVFLLGRALAGLGQTEEALSLFRKTVKIESRFHEAFFEGASLLARVGDAEAAFQLLNRACALAPDEIRYNQKLAELVLENGLDAEVGLAACDRLMVTDEDNRWRYLHWIAELYLRRGWRREARDPLQKALRLVPDHRKEERLVIEQRLAEIS